VAWDEDRLHRWIASAAAPGLLRGSPGHDACVLTRPRGREVACTDQVILGVHCEDETAPRSVGRKAAMRALSDLAATAAEPRALLLSVRAGGEVEERVIRGWIQGVREAGARHGAELAGGDLAAAPGPASLCVTALGEYLGSGRPPGRDRAKAGDWVLLTGPVGGSRLGRHLCISARMEEGRRLHAKFGARALMDVSDGLAWDLHRLARASGVRVRLHDVPIHRDARRAASGGEHDALWHALHDGEDHELIAVLAPAGARRALEDRSSALEPLSCIGRIERGSGLMLHSSLTGEEDRLWRQDEGGWRHGG